MDVNFNRVRRIKKTSENLMIENVPLFLECREKWVMKGETVFEA